MANTNLNELMALLKRQKRLLHKQFKVKDIGIFGSYARGEQTSESDLDIIVNYDDSTIDIFDFLDLRDYLSDLTKTNVDLVTKDGLKPNIGKVILSEVLYA